MEAYFFWCGVAVNALGTFGALGLLLWRSLEWWASFNEVRGPLMRFYAEELRKKKRRIPG